MRKQSFADKLYRAIHGNPGHTALVLVYILNIIALAALAAVLAYAFVPQIQIARLYNLITKLPVMIGIAVYLLAVLIYVFLLLIAACAKNKKVATNVSQVQKTDVETEAEKEVDAPDAEPVSLEDDEDDGPAEKEEQPAEFGPVKSPEEKAADAALGADRLKALENFAAPEANAVWSEIEIKNYVYANFPVAYKALGGARPTSFRDPTSGRTYIMVTKRNDAVSLTFKCGRSIGQKLVSLTHGKIVKAKFPSGPIWYEIADIATASPENLRTVIDLSHDLTEKGF